LDTISVTFWSINAVYCWTVWVSSNTINRFTTAEINIDLGGVTNHVSQNTDLDGIVDYLEEKLYETMQVAAEGVYE
jgi:hypothetical protein